MKYYLKISTTYFYDPQKEVCTEFDCKGVTIDGNYLYFNDYCNYLECKGDEEDEESDDVYILCPDDYDEVVEPCDQDGYNCEEVVYTFKEITQTQYLEYLRIISEYNNIK